MEYFELCDGHNDTDCLYGTVRRGRGRGKRDSKDTKWISIHLNGISWWMDRFESWSWVFMDESCRLDTHFLRSSRVWRIRDKDRMECRVEKEDFSACHRSHLFPKRIQAILDSQLINDTLTISTSISSNTGKLPVRTSSQWTGCARAEPLDLSLLKSIAFEMLFGLTSASNQLQSRQHDLEPVAHSSRSATRSNGLGLGRHSRLTSTDEDPVLEDEELQKTHDDLLDNLLQQVSRF